MPTCARILLKLSGEMLADDSGRGLDTEAIERVATEILEAREQGVQIAIVVGAGNLVRGAGPNRHALNVRQQRLDTMGMMATAINCTALADVLNQRGCPASHMSALGNLPFTIPLDAADALARLERGEVVLFSGGTGMPFFSTDTAAMVRALQIEADALVKGTQVDGVYDGDPRAPGSTARRLSHVDYATVLKLQLRFMDLAALALGSQHAMTIYVYNAHQPGNLAKALAGKLDLSQVGPK